MNDGTGKGRFSGRWPLSVALLLIAIQTLFSVWWLSTDSSLPDGDEVGHLGAIELYRDVVGLRGVWSATSEAFLSTSEYPPLLALMGAGILTVFPGQAPFPDGVWLLNVLCAVLSSLATYGLALAIRGLLPRSGASSSLSSWIGTLAVALLATWPLPTSLSRHAMPENLLTLFCTLTLWAVAVSRSFSRKWVAALAGLLGAAALLTKQTAILYLVVPIGVLGAVSWRRGSLGGLAIFLGCLAPLPGFWAWTHLESQALYAAQSAAEKAVVPISMHLLYYPIVIVAACVGLGGGPALVAALGVWGRARAWGALLFTFGAVVCLVMIPKKYPRLLVPATPAMAAGVASALLSGRGGSTPLLAGGFLALGVVQQVVAQSLPPSAGPARGLWDPDIVRALDPGCPQEWVRPPRADRYGFEEIVQAAGSVGRSAGAGGPLLVQLLSEPEIPCWYETTFGFRYHLQEFARRRGVELAYLDESAGSGAEGGSSASSAPRSPDLVIGLKPWCEPGVGAREEVSPRAEGGGREGKATCADREGYLGPLELRPFNPLSYQLFVYTRRLP